MRRQRDCWRASNQGPILATFPTLSGRHAVSQTQKTGSYGQIKLMVKEAREAPILPPHYPDVRRCVRINGNLLNAEVFESAPFEMRKKMKTYRLMLSLIFAPLSFSAFADDHVPSIIFGESYNFSTTNPAAVVEAMDAWAASETGKKNLANISLGQYMSNGENEATHQIVVFHQSKEAMNKQIAMNLASSDTQEFLAKFASVTTPVSENFFSFMGGTNKPGVISTSTPVQMLYALEVTDIPAFQKAFAKLLASDAVEAFPGNVSYGEVIANGDNPSTHWVSFTTNDAGTMLEANNTILSSTAFQEYAQSADSFRKVNSSAMGMGVKSWLSWSAEN